MKPPEKSVQDVVRGGQQIRPTCTAAVADTVVTAEVMVGELRHKESAQTR